MGTGNNPPPAPHFFCFGWTAARMSQDPLGFHWLCTSETYRCPTHNIAHVFKLHLMPRVWAFKIGVKGRDGNFHVRKERSFCC